MISSDIKTWNPLTYRILSLQFTVIILHPSPFLHFLTICLLSFPSFAHSPYSSSTFSLLPLSSLSLSCLHPFSPPPLLPICLVSCLHPFSPSLFLFICLLFCLHPSSSLFLAQAVVYFTL